MIKNESSNRRNSEKYGVTYEQALGIVGEVQTDTLNQVKKNIREANIPEKIINSLNDKNYVSNLVNEYINKLNSKLSESINKDTTINEYSKELKQKILSALNKDLENENMYLNVNVKEYLSVLVDKIIDNTAKDLSSKYTEEYGTPKGIMLSNLNINALALEAHEMIEQTIPGNSVLSVLPIFHGFGLAVSIHTPLLCGMKCILLPKFNAKKFGNIIKTTRPNFLVGVPTLYEALLKQKLKKNDLNCIEAVISGGDILTGELKRKIDSYLEEHGSSARVRPGYGLTEATAATCLTNEFEAGVDGIIGIPFPDTYFKIVKIGTFDQAKYEEDGEICISGPTVMLGYLNNDKETNNTLRIHDDKRIWLHTGDVGSMNEKGEIIFKQRIKRIIVSSGYNIYPSYIENIICSHKDVLTCTVIGVAHPYKGQVAKAYIVLKSGVKESSRIKKEIMEICNKNISKYALPTEYEFRDKLPTTSVGKVSFRELEDENK